MPRKKKDDDEDYVPPSGHKKKDNALKSSEMQGWPISGEEGSHQSS
jgi:hypothetical protein